MVFSRTHRPNPVIGTQGLRIEYHLEHDLWKFSYEGTHFISYGSMFSCPTQAQLDTILSDIDRLRPEMIQRLAHGWKDYEGVKLDDGEVFSVNLTDFTSERTFDISWSRGPTWGDMIIDFTIKDHAIINESWGDWTESGLRRLTFPQKPSYPKALQMKCVVERSPSISELYYCAVFEPYISSAQIRYIRGASIFPSE